MSSEQKEAASGTMVDLRNLSVINQLGDIGTEGVSENLQMLGESGGSMNVTRVGFLDIVKRHKELHDDQKVVGIRVSLRDAPGGHLLVLFNEQNAEAVTKLLLSNVKDDMSTVPAGMAKDAAEELGNMMASGFIDGWADAFGRTIDHSHPKLVYESEAAIIKRTASMGNNPFSIVYECNIVSDGQDFDTEIYLFPEMEAFIEMVNSIGDV